MSAINCSLPARPWDVSKSVGILPDAAGIGWKSGQTARALRLSQRRFRILESESGHSLSRKVMKGV